MKHFFLTLIIVTSFLDSKSQNSLDSINKENERSIRISGKDIQKAIVSKSDSIIEVYSSKYVYHRIFGFAEPDTSSRKLILISCFTNDVENNPFEFPLGAYYNTSDMNVIGKQLKFITIQGKFIKTEFVAEGNGKRDFIYFEKKWIEFEK